MSKKLSITDIVHKKSSQEKIVTITAYDYTMANLFDPWVDIILVGDSLGMVVQGEKNTLGVTLDQMIYHSKAVSKASFQAHLCVDMPFMSYQACSKEALKNAGRLLSEGYAESVKLEGGCNIASTVENLVSHGVPVMGHIGMTPQSVHQMGGFVLQGRTQAARESLIQDAIALEDAGIFALVLEMVPEELAKEISERIEIPTIGIGAGRFCDGQVLVGYDLLGMNPDFNPKFLKKYADLAGTIEDAVREYVDDVKTGKFPTEGNTFHV